MSEQRRGFLYGAAAYLLWGAFPLYFPLLEPAGAIEILSHRVSWALLTMAAITVAAGRRAQLRAILADRRARTLLAGAAAVIAVNWGTYIWGVNNHRVVESALGYFINPLVTVLMGVLVLGEQLRRWQWVAVGIASVAVVGLAVEYGRPPWVALVLAFSFGTYGLFKKQAGAGAVESLTFETMLLAPLAIAFLVWQGAAGQSHFTSDGTGHALLLVSTGVVTAIPLMCFGAAAIRVPMTTLGLLQYVTPTLQFLLGITLLDEHMSAMRWAGFGLVWLALVVFTVESVRHHRRELALAAEASAL
ncbi:MAG: EamA family transporter RarD [Nocardioidaceae bacterium]|nr:EamA family transporter RarD [Nocardioidaceae bacterium]